MKSQTTCNTHLLPSNQMMCLVASFYTFIFELKRKISAYHIHSIREKSKLHIFPATRRITRKDQAANDPIDEVESE